MATWLFPGQGSQKLGMGEGLFEAFPEVVAQADDLLGYSIKQLCLEDPNSELGLTQFTQPALYIVNALMMLKRLETEASPAYVAGHSLGEYNALLASEVFDFVTGLQMVKKRGELMSLASGGGMAAIIGLTVPEIQGVIAEHQLLSIETANYNSPLQTVITGEKSAIEQSLPFFKDAGARMVVPLKVSGAFHSSLMSQAREAFEDYLQGMTFSEPRIPIISNVKAQPYGEGQVTRLLCQQITSSVRWTDSIRYLMAAGETEFVEVGPGKVLSGLVAAIQKG